MWEMRSWACSHHRVANCRRYSTLDLCTDGMASSMNLRRRQTIQLGSWRRGPAVEPRGQVRFWQSRFRRESSRPMMLLGKRILSSDRALIRSGSHQIGLSSDRGPRDGQGHRRAAMAATRGSVAQPKRFCGKGGPCRGDLWQGKGNLGFAEMAMAQFSSPRRRLAHEIDQITGTRPAWLCHGG
jgi:hypothetical protein